MKAYYFTFGSWRLYPYQNTYLVIMAADFNDAVREFRNKYPDVHENCLNCSFWYDKERWERIGKTGYDGKLPAEVIWTESCWGEKQDGYDDVFIYVPETQEIIRIAEESGDNLLPEDIEDGYVDYIYYEQYKLEPEIPEYDGGQILLEEMFRDKYRCTADSIPDVLSMAYGSYMYDCMILPRRSEDNDFEKKIH